MERIHPVYDCRHVQNVPAFSYLLIIPIIIGLSVFFYNLLNGGEKKIIGIVMGVVFVLFGLTSFLAVISTKITANEVAMQIYSSGKYKVTAGVIRNYHPAPAGGHEPETFDVDTVHFEIWDADLTIPGYNATAVSGSIIQPNLYVKIAYAKIYGRNVILRLEAAE